MEDLSLWCFTSKWFPQLNLKLNSTFCELVGLKSLKESLTHIQGLCNHVDYLILYRTDVTKTKPKSRK